MSVFTDFFERARALLFRSRDEREMQDELRFHLDMEAEQNKRAGLSDDEARRRGHIALGGVERTKEDVRDARGTRYLEDIVGDVSFARRTLARSPGFAIVAILTLAIGIGGTTAVYSAVDAVLVQPLPYQEPGRLARLYFYSDHNRDERGFVSPVLFMDYRSKLAAFDGAAAVFTYGEAGADVGTGDRVRRVRVLHVSSEYFDVIRTRPRLGAPFGRESENGAPLAIVSDGFWKSQFQGDPAVVGSTVMLSGVAHTVAGVMPAGYVDPLVSGVDVWLPGDLREGLDITQADNHYLSVIARLRPGVSLAQAQSELDILGAQLNQRYLNANKTGARLYPLKDDIVGSASRALEIMLGAVALVLVLVCVNVANLLLVRGSDRAREFAVRSALGAERSRLVRQMLIESLTLALLGDLAGLIVARVAMSAIVALGSGSIPRLAELTLDPRLLVFSVLIATLSAVGFGMAPALRAARTQPGDVLREESRGSTGGLAHIRLREWLVVSQVALAFVLLAGAGLLIESARRLGEVDLGVKPAGAFVFDLSLPPARYDSTGRARAYEEIARKIEEIPGVVAAGGISKLPATGNYHQWGATVLSGPLNGAKDGHGPTQNRVVSGDYFKSAGIPVLEGRAFESRDDNAAPSRVLVSASLAKRLFPGISAIGQRLRAGNRANEIIGVVGDVAMDAEGGDAMYVYYPHLQFAGERVWSLTQIVRTSGPPDAANPAVRQVVAAIDPLLVMHRPSLFAEAIGRSEAQRVFTLRILASFALVALALSALGIFGVLSYGVRLRTKEFGIRMALGAEAGGIRRMVLRQGLTVATIGIGAGLLGALALSRLMSSLVFHVSTLDPVVLSGAAAFMVLIASLAAYLPARRATAVDPRAALQ
jgi:putative ABC transport system permease protein